MTKKEMQSIVTTVLSAIENAGGVQKPVVSREDRQAKREASIVNGFKRKGFKEAQIKLRENIKPYKLWLESGRQVRKGERGVRGLFHVDQTDPIQATA